MEGLDFAQGSADAKSIVHFQVVIADKVGLGVDLGNVGGCVWLTAPSGGKKRQNAKRQNALQPHGVPKILNKLFTS